MLKKSTKKLCPWSAFSLLMAAACSSNGPFHSPSAEASPNAACAEVGGAWDQAANACQATGTNAKRITVKVSAQYPADLVDDPTSGPVLKGFLRQFFTKFGRPDNRLPQDGDASLAYKTYKHVPNTQSVVFTQDWFLGGAHPNDEIDTFTFDLANKKQLSLSDLFCPGIDPLTALPPLARPYVEQAAGFRTDSRLHIKQFEPQPGHGGYTDDYKAWYLDGDDLVLIMPAGRSGPVHAGAWQPHVPLSALKPILRETGCSA